MVGSSILVDRISILNIIWDDIYLDLVWVGLVVQVSLESTFSA